MSRKITIGHLYPALLNLYGDRGNIASLTKRCEWRGIEAEVITYDLGEEIDFEKLDIILLGGGSDREQKLVCEALRAQKESLAAYVEEEGVLLAVCGGYEMLGTSYETANETVEGLGLLDMKATYGKERLMGNAVIKSELTDMPIVGFENHTGRMQIGSYKPLGQLVAGKGNTGESGSEGVVYKNVIGTYLYGPLLPKNPQLCDWLLLKALEKRYGVSELEVLDDALEKEANAYIVKRFAEQRDN